MDERKKAYLDALSKVSYDGIINYFSSDRNKVVFGKGRQSTVIYELFRLLGMLPNALISSTNEELAEEKWTRQIPSFRAIEYTDKNADVLIAVGEKWQDEVKKSLLDCGYSHIYVEKDWNTFNECFRVIYFEMTMRQNRIDVSKDVLEYDAFRICNPLKMGTEYKDSFFSESIDLLYPFLFNDISACIEGPYEYDNVCIPEDGVVVDAGANIGMFSCCAASRRSRVYAFEPSGDLQNVLLENAKLYGDRIRIVNAALADQTGRVSFSVSEDGHNNKNRIGNEQQANHHVVPVDCYSLDDFVEKNCIEKVDFIKADIEGAERMLLMGAKKVLQEHAPMLSICTYHLPDDPEILEKLILEANPGYVVEHKWNKLYAYVPK